MYKKYDFTQIQIQKYNVNSRIYHRLKNWWDIKEIDGVKVFSQKMDFWNEGARGLVKTKEFNRFIKALGLTPEDLDEDREAGRDYDELVKVYFTLAKINPFSKKLGIDYLKNALDKLPNEVVLTVSTQDGERYFSDSGSTFDKERAIQEVRENILYQYLWGYKKTHKTKLSQAHKIEYDLPKYTVVKDTLENEPLYDDNGNIVTDDDGNIIYNELLSSNKVFAALTPDLFTIKEVVYATGFTTTNVGSRNNAIVNIDKLPNDYPQDLKDYITEHGTSQRISSDANVRLDIKLVLEKNRDAYNSDVALINEWFEEARKVYQLDEPVETPGLEKEFYIGGKPNYYDIMQDLLSKEFPIPDDEVWYKGHLRHDPFYGVKDSNGDYITRPTMTRKDLGTALNYGFGSGYKVKDAEPWEIITAVIIIIAAIVTTVLSFGSASGPAISVTIAVLGALSALGSIALALHGGRSAYWVSKTIGDVMVIIGVISLISGFVSYMNKVADAATKQTASAAAAGSTTITTTVDIIIDSAIEAVKEAFSSVKAFSSALSSTTLAINNVISTVKNLYNMVVPNHSASSIDEFPDDTEAERLVFEGEQFEQLTKIDMMYADLYDYSKYYSTNERKSMI